MADYSDLIPKQQSSSANRYADLVPKKEAAEPAYTPTEAFGAPSFAEGELPQYGKIAKAAYLTAKENIPMIEKGMMKGPEAQALKALFPQRMAKVERGIERSQQDIEREMAKIPPGEAAMGMALSPSVPYAGGKILGAAEKSAAKVLGKTADVAERIRPGSMERAASKLSEIGTATDKSQLGQKLSTYLENRLSNLQETRRAQADKLKNAYYKQASGKEPQILDRYRGYLEGDYARNKGRMSREEQSLLKDSYSRLAGDKTIEGMEKELRRLKDIQNAPKPLEGIDAVPRIKAGDMAANLEKILNRVAPKGKVYRQAYREASEPINLFDIALGQKATKGAAERVSQFKATDPADLPKAFFQTRDSVKKLRELANNDKFVMQSAKEHIANELTGLDGKQAMKWYRDNELWLDELNDIQPIKEQTRAYVDNLAKTQGVVKNRNDVLKGLGVAGLGYSGYQGIKSIFGI